MKINYSMDIKQTQKLQMTKELKQAIELLNMNFQEVEGLISDEIKENPLLEFENKPEIEWDKYIKDIKNIKTKTTYYDEDSESNPENYLEKQISIYEHLEGELCLLKLTTLEKSVSQLIIENVDENGYFKGSIKNLSKELCVTEVFMQSTLKKLQQCEPTGIFARDIIECLSLQLEKKYPKGHVILKIVEEDLEDIANKKYQNIQKKHKIKESELSEIIKSIKSLEPKPGRIFSYFAPQYVLPDVKVEKVGAKWEILNNHVLPELFISDVYSKLLLNTSELDKETEKYIKEKLTRASNLIKNIEQRKNTIQKVAKEIVESQQTFFEKGSEYLLPMRLKDIAEITGFHESTISRAVNGKYMLTPRGMFEFKYFFTTSVSKIDGAQVSNKSIKYKIKEIIDTENKLKPISDQKICDLLIKEGIEVSRRTITKYREELEIPSSTQRKEI